MATCSKKQLELAVADLVDELEDESDRWWRGCVLRLEMATKLECAGDASISTESVQTIVCDLNGDWIVRLGECVWTRTDRHVAIEHADDL